MQIPMDPRVISTILRYIGYGWKNSIIISLVRYRFDAPITSKCVDNIRYNRPCKERCMEHCQVKDVEIWFHPHPWE